MTRSEARSRTVTALTIAGSDPSGGAGVQADLKAMSALGAYGMSVITALTAQSTRGVTGVRAVPVDFVRLQLDTLLDDIVPDATKIGMLATAELADAVGEYLPGLSRTVLDPVMVATSGDRLLDEEAVGAVRRLCGVADLITPNLHEAAVLLGEEAAADTGALRAQARRLVEQGAQRVLVKGGHFAAGAGSAAGTAGTADAPESVDVYADADSTVLLRGRRVMTKNTHGTGCTLSSAIASLRPRRETWLEAVRDAKAYLTGAIEHADALGVEAIHPLAWELVQGGVREALAQPGELAAGVPEAYEGLCSGLVMSGLAMQVARGTRPASGAEHYFSHLWELDHLGAELDPPLSHGFKVAIGTLAMTSFHERFLARDLAGLDVDAAVGRWPSWEEIERDIRGTMSGPLIDKGINETREKYVDADALRVRIDRLVESWPRLRSRLRDQLMPAERLQRMLGEAGAPTRPEDIGLSVDDVRQAFPRAMYYRSRYTVLDVARELGWFEEITEEVFAPGGVWT